MKPTSEFRKRLFESAGALDGRIVEFSCGHVIPQDNILPIIITKNVEKQPLLFNFESRFLMVI